ncbi:hypothetical protein AcW1_003222 [Taiwanofungus camphoratus]|nr:hypothetical protein AcW1_003222 [Antrodia cinnamomea]
MSPRYSALLKVLCPMPGSLDGFVSIFRRFMQDPLGIRYHLHTLLLFTWADMKTILLPITAFACSTAPLHSFSNLVQGMIWIWLHQLLCNVSNQARGKSEDALNKPWRPLPSGRLTEPQAVILRWITVAVCLLLSATYGRDLLMTTVGLILTTLLYDELGMASHHIGKNLCNIGGYTTIEVGATKLMGASRDLDYVSTVAVIISGVLIFTTIQAQDFPDIEGDAALGRVTFPIYAPEFSRIFTFIVMPAWSIFLGWFWDIGVISRMVFAALGTYVGLRYYLWRTVDIDKRSYVFFNAWLTLAHILPLSVRTGFLAF